jgi:hypothetical protein
MHPLLFLIFWYAVLVMVLASRSSSREIIASGAPSFDLLLFLVVLIMGGSLLVTPDNLCLAPFFVIIFFFIAPLLLTRLGVYGYISVEKWLKTTHRKRKEYQAAQSIEAVLEDASYRLGDDGELEEIKRQLKQTTHVKETKKHL